MYSKQVLTCRATCCIGLVTETNIQYEFCGHMLYCDNDSGNESDHNTVNLGYSSKYTVAQVFTNDQEAEVSKYIKTCSNMNCSMTYKKIRLLAYDYARILPSCKIPDQWGINKKASIDWLKGFMKRNRDNISLRKPENLAKATGFNRKAVSEFFDNYCVVFKQYKFKSEQIYNIDETGVTTVLKPVKILST
ncbi:hypothetical protein MML48_1g05839 [Holotrichia oblita]|uniref:Uncharacterized protein n=1 Tax=Holotrichia oblita TaxID=644536 RepID=A0ACB9TW19_HOLOL|nr:hypothetical protein MML48_1g05839 [Holotrichia oblita]